MPELTQVLERSIEALTALDDAASASGAHAAGGAEARLLPGGGGRVRADVACLLARAVATALLAMACGSLLCEVGLLLDNGASSACMTRQSPLSMREAADALAAMLGLRPDSYKSGALFLCLRQFVYVARLRC